ncbi:MAG TPA: SDR family oxidoreductase [Terriglobales bacterium]|nr:SDR family oxidoreductase [Terriglobales bacterium]
MQDRSFTDQVIVITGASSGFGKGAARQFAACRAKLVLAARRAALIEELARECQGLGAAAFAVETDVADRSDVERLAQTAVLRFGSIDIWINNAGVGAIGPFERVPLADHVKVVETDLLGTIYGSHCAYRQFLSQGSGTLINIASELGRHTVPYYASYAAAKHGVVGFSDALRQEVMQSDNRDTIHICTVMPTAHDTPFFDHAANYTGHEVQAPTPLHDPQNVVDAIVRIAANPKDKEIVGADGIVKVLLKNLAPGIAERAAAKQMHMTQMMKAPIAPDSPGAVRSPTPSGTEVSAGRLRASA